MTAMAIQPVLAATAGGVEWPSTVLAITIILVIGGIMVVAIWRYDKADDAVKIGSLLAGIFGVVIGSFGTYFFTRPGVEARIAQASTQAKTTALADVSKSFSHVAMKLDDPTWVKFTTAWKEAAGSDYAIALLPTREREEK